MCVKLDRYIESCDLLYATLRVGSGYEFGPELMICIHVKLAEGRGGSTSVSLHFHVNGKFYVCSLLAFQAKIGTKT